MHHSDRDPMKELLIVQKRMNQLFDGAMARTDFETQEGFDTWTPACDIYQTAEGLVICLELPGMSPEDIDLKIDGDELVVSGHRTMGKEKDGERFHRVERSYGRFSRVVHLPSNVSRTDAQASYRDGLLRICLPTSGDRSEDTLQLKID